MTEHMVEELPPRVLVVMGVSGSGKSTVAAMLAGRLGWDLEEGDDLHPEANIRKMSEGHPLTDEDRWPWLDKIAEWIDLHLVSGAPGIITCSALKRTYRDRMRRPGVCFVHLDLEQDRIAERLAKRLDHFMPSSLLASQFQTLEELEPDEFGIIVKANGTPRAQVGEIERRLELS